MQFVAVLILLLVSAGVAAAALSLVRDAVPKIRGVLRGEDGSPVPAVSRAVRSPSSTRARTPTPDRRTNLPLRVAA